jgi:hypothetical protein
MGTGIVADLSEPVLISVVRRPCEQEVR